MKLHPINWPKSTRSGDGSDPRECKRFPDEPKKE